MNVQFYNRAIALEKKATDGLQSFKNVVYIRITRSAIHIIDRPCNAQDREAYAAEYERFKAANDIAIVPEGETALTGWPQITAADIKILQVRDINSVQQLAKLKTNKTTPDQVIELKDKAIAFINVGKNQAGMAEKLQELDAKLVDLSDLLTEKDTEIKALSEENAALNKQITTTAKPATQIKK